MTEPGDYFDRDGKPITAQQWSEYRKDREYCFVANTLVFEGDAAEPAFRVSTVWFGLFAENAYLDTPLRFETCTFGPQGGSVRERYITEDAAREGHARHVKDVAATLDDPLLVELDSITGPGGVVGDYLDLETYLADFRLRSEIKGSDSWKLERQQSFQEVGNASWDAFTRGDWDESLRLIAERRDRLKEYYRQAEQAGVTRYRVRVVTEPITPYLQWELNSLLQRSECGERIRIVEARDVAEYEPVGELPEIITLGADVVYEVRYDKDGAAEGAVRSLNPDVVAKWRDFIGHLYRQGEDIDAYCERNGDVLRRVDESSPDEVTPCTYSDT